MSWYFFKFLPIATAIVAISMALTMAFGNKGAVEEIAVESAVAVEQWRVLKTLVDSLKIELEQGGVEMTDISVNFEDLLVTRLDSLKTDLVALIGSNKPRAPRPVVLSRMYRADGVRRTVVGGVIETR